MGYMHHTMLVIYEYLRFLYFIVYAYETEPAVN